MALTPGTRLGVYDIKAQIGAGGMGEVYRAHDTKLNRDVALKILPSAFARDAERLARFKREAQVLASLNHPHIGHIYGFEDSGETHALVLELIEGPTIADRLARGPLPVHEALAIARQIAEALEAAHEQGIVHRDLKPANIKVRDDGTVKVLDFGLAKAMDPASNLRPDLTNSPTITSPAMMTGAGMILGTAAYMSPEQAKGRPADKRSDVWAFGCILYEMLTGRQVFKADAASETLAMVLMNEPDWSALPVSLPPAVRSLVRRCLEKDRKHRVADLSTVLFVLADPTAFGPAADSMVKLPGARRHLMYSAIVVAALALAVIAVALTRRPTPASSLRPARFTIVPPAAERLRISNFDRDLVISPDGTRIVYVGGSNPRRLIVRSIDRLDDVSLVALDDSRGIPFSAFVSPDSQWVGYFDNGRDGPTLKKVSIAGGGAIALCRIPSFARGASWGLDGTIVFASGSGLFSVPSGGGDPKVLTTPDRAGGEREHLFPSVLPDGQGVLFTIAASPTQRENDQVAVLDLKSGHWKTVIRGASQAEYLEGGYLVYSASGSLRAVRFDLARRAVVGDPITIVDHLMTASTGAADFAISRDGTLVYVPTAPSARRSLVWVDRQGREEPIKAPLRAFAYPRLSPDGTRVAVDIRDQENDIWIWHLVREALARLTFSPLTDEYPVWTPDGQRVVFASARPDGWNVLQQRADGSGNPEVLMASPEELSPTAVSRDGTRLVLEGFTLRKESDIGLLNLDGASPQTGKSRIDWIVKTELGERNGILSPDGRWLAYQASNTGQFEQFEIYVQPFPDLNAGRWQVSTSGGTRPLWSRDGRELFFLDGKNVLTAVAVQPSASAFNPGKPRRVLETAYFTAGNGRTYDVAVDGQRFLMIKDDPAAGQTIPAMVVVLNWLEELKRIAPTR